MVARLLGSQSSLKAVSTNAAHLFHMILTYFLSSAGHRHCWFYHLQSSSPRTLRSIFLRKAKWRSEITAQPLEQEQCCCVRRGTGSVRNIAWLRASRGASPSAVKDGKTAPASGFSMINAISITGGKGCEILCEINLWRCYHQRKWGKLLDLNFSSF